MKKILVLCVFSFLFLAGCSALGMTKDNCLEKVMEKITNLDDYEAKIEMTINKDDKTYHYNVVVDYLKGNYLVKMNNLENSNLQIILKNDDGVFVLTPSLNKSFKFESEWPLNSYHAYLPESIIKEMANKNPTVEEENSFFVLENSVSSKTNSLVSSQRVYINPKTSLIEKVIVYDSSKNIINEVKIKEFNTNAKLKQEMFILENAMESSILELGEGIDVLKEFQEPTYVVNGSVLDNSNVSATRVISQYVGDNNYTVVQTRIDESETMVFSQIYDSPVILVNGVGALSDNTITWYNGKVKYMIFSNTLGIEELINIANSL